MTRFPRHALTFVGGALAALTLGHFAVIVASHGPGDISGGGADGHEASWMIWSVVAVLAAVGLVGLAVRNLRAMARPAAALRMTGRDLPAAHLAPYLRRVAWSWARLLVAVSVLYVLQENVEFIRVGPVMPGLDVFGLVGGHLDALPFIALVTLVVAAVIALADWCRCLIASRRAASKSRPNRPPSRLSLPIATDVALVSAILAQWSAGRSPPHGAPARA